MSIAPPSPSPAPSYHEEEEEIEEEVVEEVVESDRSSVHSRASSRASEKRRQRGIGCIIPINHTFLIYLLMSIPFSPTDIFANSVDPDEMLVKCCLIWIYTRFFCF